MAKQLARDPVCGKPVDKLRAPAVAIVAGETLYFCSEACKARHLGRPADGQKTPPRPSSPPRRRFVTNLPRATVLRVPEAATRPPGRPALRGPSEPGPPEPTVRPAPEPGPPSEPGRAAPPPVEEPAPRPAPERSGPSAEPEAAPPPAPDPAQVPTFGELFAEEFRLQRPELESLPRELRWEAMKTPKRRSGGWPVPVLEVTEGEPAPRQDRGRRFRRRATGPLPGVAPLAGAAVVEQTADEHEDDEDEERTEPPEGDDGEPAGEEPPGEGPPEPPEPDGEPVGEGPPEPPEPDGEPAGEEPRAPEPEAEPVGLDGDGGGVLRLEAELPPVEHTLLVGVLSPEPEPGLEPAPEPPLDLEPEPVAPPAARRIRHLVLEVDDMSCPSCALRVERAIQGVPGVISSSTNAALGWAVVELDVDEARRGGGGDGIGAIVRSVQRIGYRATVRKESTERRLTLIERSLFARFCVAAGALAVLAAMERVNASPLALVVLGMIVLLGAGLPLLADAIKRIRHLSVNCNTLTAVGAMVAYGLGLYQVLAAAWGVEQGTAALFEASAAVVTFALLTQLIHRGTYRRMRSRAQRVLRRSPALVPLVLEAQVTKGRRQIAIDTLVRVGLPVTGLLASVALLLWNELGVGVAGAVIPAVALVAAASPHGLGVSVTLATMAGLQRAAERKVLFRDVENVELLADMTALVATKSVVAQGTPRVQESVLFHTDEARVLSLVAGAEVGSIQPAGRALYDHAVMQGVRPAEVQSVEMLPGYGLRATRGAERVLIGSRTLMEREGVDLGAASQTEARLTASGQSLAYAAVDGVLAGVFALADRARPGVGSIVGALRGLGVHTTLLTGDPPGAARAMALEAGMDDVLASVPPEERARELTDSRDVDGVLAVAGDPARDGGLMQVGDVAVAVSESVTSSVVPTPGVWLVRGTFADLIPAVEVARHVRTVAAQNGALAVAWTLGLMGAAVLGLLGGHGPLIAGGGAALLSSVLVVSAGRLLGRQPPVR